MIERDFLESYFLASFDLDDDPTENDPDEESCREKRLENAFKQPLSKLYALFVQSVTSILDNFNSFLQAEEPLINILYHFTLRLCRSLLLRFILPEVISESDELEDRDILEDFNSIFIGAMTK